MGVAANYLAQFKSVEELLVMMTSLLAEGTSGKTVVQWSMGDSSAQKAQWMSMPPWSRATEVGLALSIKDPDTYPPDTFIQIKQTKPAFS